MDLNVQDWKTFLLRNIFNIKYGVNLELNTCEETFTNDAINFISRTETNNGVSAKVRAIDGIAAQKAGLITVAGGGSVLSTFVQPKPFYSGRDLYTLDAKEPISMETKFFITTIIEANKFRYNYGRQANKTLPFIELKLPTKKNSDGSFFIDIEHKFSDEGYVPDWQFMEDYIKSIHHKPLTTQNKSGQVPDLNVADWGEFKIPDYFDVYAGKYYSKDDYEKGPIPYVSASDTNNGICDMTNLKADFKGNKITIGKVGATAYYQPSDFCATSDVNVLSPKFEMNVYTGLFITQIINTSENYRWSYGRQCRVGDTLGITIKLPKTTAATGEVIPDWQFMEDYIKALPYGDKLG